MHPTICPVDNLVTKSPIGRKTVFPGPRGHRPSRESSKPGQVTDPYRKQASAALPDGRLLPVEPQGQAFGTAARLEELIELDHHRLIASGAQVGRQLLAAGVRDHGPATTTALQPNRFASRSVTANRRGTWVSRTRRP